MRIALLGAIPVVFLAGCGGCPWTETSEATVEPPTACLVLQVADSSGDAPSTGCVNPVLHGSNDCSDDLTIPAAWAASGTDEVFAAGSAVEVEIRLDSTAELDGVYEYAIAASLGKEPITIWFTAD